MTVITSSAAADPAIPTPWSTRLMPYMLLAPAVLVTVFIVFMPMVQAVWTSFYDLILWKPNASRFVGFGTRLANGCTSGHGIFGLSNFERPSLMSTLSFMAGGFVTTQIVYRVLFN